MAPQPFTQCSERRIGHLGGADHQAAVALKQRVRSAQIRRPPQKSWQCAVDEAFHKGRAASAITVLENITARLISADQLSRTDAGSNHHACSAYAPNHLKRNGGSERALSPFRGVTSGRFIVSRLVARTLGDLRRFDRGLAVGLDVAVTTLLCVTTDVAFTEAV